MTTRTLTVYLAHASVAVRTLELTDKVAAEMQKTGSVGWDGPERVEGPLCFRCRAPFGTPDEACPGTARAGE